MENGSSKRLAAAAQELVSAAASGTEAESLATSKSIVEELKALSVTEKSVVGGLKTLSADSAAFKGVVEVKIAALTQSVSDLKAIMESQEKRQRIEFASQEKWQRIEFALQNLDLVDEFFCYKKGSNGWGYGCTTATSKDPEGMLQSILMNFRVGTGSYMSEEYVLGKAPVSNLYTPAPDPNISIFRKHIRSTLQKLLGVPPRLAKENDGRHTIWYS